MCTALTYDNMLDHCFANGAFLTGSPVHSKVILKFAAAIHPVERSSIAPYAFVQDAVDRFMQRGCLSCRYAIARGERM